MLVLTFKVWIQELEEDGLGTMQAEFANAIEARFFGKSSILENKVHLLSTLLDPG